VSEKKLDKTDQYESVINLKHIYDILYECYGPQAWWPGDGAFEVMIGAILTQNTAWANVEKAIDRLKLQSLLDPQAIINAGNDTLAECLKPSGYFNVKAQRLKEFCKWYLAMGGMDILLQQPTDELRKGLLSVKGVGPETADDILLYAFHKPVFVIDAYTRRLFTRLDAIAGDEGYESLRRMFEEELGHDVQLFNEYHALIVTHAKHHCRVRPLCQGCCLENVCHYNLGKPC
jgi:endonuclease-3 related protein